MHADPTDPLFEVLLNQPPDVFERGTALRAAFTRLKEELGSLLPVLHRAGDLTSTDAARLLPLEEVRPCLESILELRLAALSDDTRARLAMQVFAPAEQLLLILDSVRQTVADSLWAGRGDRLDKLIAQPPGQPDPGPPFNSPLRYRAADRLAVRRLDGSVTTGVCIGRSESTVLVTYRNADGTPAVSGLSSAELIALNPLKLGEYAVPERGTDIYITADRVGDQGVVGRAFPLSGAAPVEVDTAHLTAATREPSASQLHQISGGAEIQDPVVIRHAYGTAAMLVDKGVNYKPINEDSGALVSTATELGQVIADQAGGMGHLDGAETGIASKLGVEAVARGVLAPGDGQTVPSAIVLNLRQVHAYLIDRSRAAQLDHEICSTLASAVLVAPRRVHVTAVGDAQVLLYSKDGRLKRASPRNNLFEIRARKNLASNYAPEVRAAELALCYPTERSSPGSTLGFSKTELEIYDDDWDAEPGDYIVCCSDGILNANSRAEEAAVKARNLTELGIDQTHREMGEILALSGGAEAGVRNLQDYAHHHMASGLGSGDNSGISVTQVA